MCAPGKMGVHIPRENVYVWGGAFLLPPENVLNRCIGLQVLRSVNCVQLCCCLISKLMSERTIRTPDEGDVVRTYSCGAAAA